MSKKLAGKIALVTGGTSGIGLGVARELVAEGSTVFITGRRQAELDATVAGLGNGVTGVRADVSKADDLDRLFAQIRAQAGSLDIVVANAGGGDMMSLATITEEHFDRIFDINVKGVVFTVQKSLTLLKDGGSVVLMGSTAASEGNENFSVYGASKAAVRNFARSWILDLKPRGIRVNVVSPGPIRTPGLGGLAPAGQEEGLFAHFASRIPLGRIGEPHEIGHAVVFLASDDSSFVNGVELFVDGGYRQA